MWKAFPGCAGNATGLLKGVFMKYFEFFMTLLGYAAIFGLYFYLIFHIGRRKTIENEGIVYTGHRPKKKKKRLFYDIFLKLPFQVGKDAARVMPDDFPYKGIVVFTGMQGSGKSIAMVQFARTMKEQYPDAMVLSNTALNFEDEAITDFQPIVDTKNGRKGVIICLDELQNWFNSKGSTDGYGSKDFPPEMLSVITQNRKNRRIILSTTQNFYMLAKDIRCQTSCGEIRSCFTLFGALTIVIRRRPVFDSEGALIKTKFLGMYYFVHDDELRNCYDTYAVVDYLSKSGFKPLSERYSLENQSQQVVNNYNFPMRRRRKGL